VQDGSISVLMQTRILQPDISINLVKVEHFIAEFMGGCKHKNEIAVIAEPIIFDW
jgi:hypothetical protein